MSEQKGDLGEGVSQEVRQRVRYWIHEFQVLEDTPRAVSRSPVVSGIWISAERQACGRLATEALGLAEPSQGKED